MRRVSEYAFRATLFQRFCRFTQGAAGVDHIVDHHAVTTGNVADDVHHLGDVGARTALVDDSHIGIIQQFSDSAGTHDAADVRRNHNRVVQVQLQHIFQQDWAAEHVIDWHIEEALDLFCVQVNGQHAVNADAGQKIRHHFRGDWHTSRTNTTVLTSITEVRDNGGDTTCRSTTQSINHNNQFHQVVIGGSTSGLDDENITTAYVFIDLYADFAVAKTTYSGVAKRSVQAVGNTLC